MPWLLAVKTLDTNVVVRLLIGDDPQQTPIAEQAFLVAIASGGVYLPDVVLAEVAWVLRGYDLERATRYQLLERLGAAGRFVTTGLSYASSTPFNQEIGSYRRLDWLSTDLSVTRELKNRLGASVNDVVLAIVAGALRRFLVQSRAVDVADLDFRVLAPVSLRAEDQRGMLRRFETGGRSTARKVPEAEA